MDAVIIGGGIGGLAAAAAIISQGDTARVLERSPDFGPLGAALLLWPNAIAALRALGAERQIARAAWPLESSTIYAFDGRRLARSPVGLVSRDLNASTFAIRRASLHGVLRGLVPAEAVRLGTPVESVDDDGAEPCSPGPAARLAGGETVRGDVLIGADGVRSRVREHVAPSAPPTAVGHVMWRGIAPFDDPSLRAGHSAEWWGHGARFGAVQVDAGHVAWHATINLSESPPGPAQDPVPRLRERFGLWRSPVPELLESAASHPIIRTVIRDRPPLPTWVRGRVTLLGDAAHAMTPDLGQGACCALEDAVTLARCLARARGPEDIRAALARYDALRRPAANDIALRSRRMARVGQWQGPAWCTLRNAVVSLIPRGMARRGLRRLVAGTLAA